MSRKGSPQPRPDVADPEAGSAVEHDNRRRLTVPSPSFDGHRRPSREQANLKIVEQRVVAQPIEHEPDVRVASFARGRHHTASGARISVLSISSAMRRRLSARSCSRNSDTSARST